MLLKTQRSSFYDTIYIEWLAIIADLADSNSISYFNYFISLPFEIVIPSHLKINSIPTTLKWRLVLTSVMYFVYKRECKKRKFKWAG